MYADLINLPPAASRPGYDSNNRLAQMSRTIAIGLLASGIPIRAGNRFLREPWEINHVPIECVLRTMDGYELCGPNAAPMVETVAEVEAAEAEKRKSEMPAADWLRHLLAGGPVNSTKIFVQARIDGRTPKSVRKAAKAINVSIYQGNRAWWWALKAPVSASDDR
jgi:hypothetical protein